MKFSFEIKVETIIDNYFTELNQIEGFSSMTESQKAQQRAMLFQKYRWIYTNETKTLVNDKISEVLGLTISATSDEHGSWVKDFANGARDLYEGYLNEVFVDLFFAGNNPDYAAEILYNYYGN